MTIIGSTVIFILIIAILINLTYREYMKNHYYINRYHFNFIDIYYLDNDIKVECELEHEYKFYLKLLEKGLKILYRDNSIESHKVESMSIIFNINKNKTYDSILIKVYENNTLLEVSNLKASDIYEYTPYINKILSHIDKDYGTITVTAKTYYE